MSGTISSTTARYLRELTSLLDKMVRVKTIQNKSFYGRLIGYDPNNLNLILSNAKDNENNAYSRILIRGDVITEIIREEEPFDLKGLAQRLEKIFPNNVTLLEDAGVIVVSNKIRITEEGIIEGSGPLADKVKTIYEAFIKEKQSEK
ncbi:MAG: Lsm family RNA-binding protein [Nitrososphaeria archaeon]